MYFPIFQHLHGKFALHPFCDRKLPIICDDVVDPEFGTGMHYVKELKDEEMLSCC